MGATTLCVATAALLALAYGTYAWGDDNAPAAARGEERGIATQYPGDAGIDRDPDVIFAEDFEHADVAALIERWTSARWPAGMSLVDDVPAASSGRKAVRLTSVGQPGEGDNASTLYKAFPEGYDQVYLRWYVKYVSGQRYRHAGGRLGGFWPVRDEFMGIAGRPPQGDDHFFIAAEPVWDSPLFDFYVYWMGMRRYSDGWWGNHFLGGTDVRTKVDEWMCVEVMVKVNDPVTESSGELALWIDGEPIIHMRPGHPRGEWRGGAYLHITPDGEPFEGFQWRKDERLKINYIQLEQYINPQDDPPGFVGQVYIDDVVLARKYIGPIAEPQRGR